MIVIKQFYGFRSCPQSLGYKIRGINLAIKGDLEDLQYEEKYGNDDGDKDQIEEIVHKS